MPATSVVLLPMAFAIANNAFCIYVSRYHGLSRGYSGVYVLRRQPTCDCSYYHLFHLCCKPRHALPTQARWRVSAFLPRYQVLPAGVVSVPRWRPKLDSMLLDTRHPLCMVTLTPPRLWIAQALCFATCTPLDIAHSCHWLLACHAAGCTSVGCRGQSPGRDPAARLGCVHGGHVHGHGDGTLHRIPACTPLQRGHGDPGGLLPAPHSGHCSDQSSKGTR